MRQLVVPPHISHYKHGVMYKRRRQRPIAASNHLDVESYFQLMDTIIRFSWLVLFNAIGIGGLKGDETGSNTAHSQSNTSILLITLSLSFFKEMKIMKEEIKLPLKLYSKRTI